MKQAFIFNTEAEAERFCKEGYPKYGTDLEGNIVMDKGVTLQAAEWRKHAVDDVWVVEYNEIFKDRDLSLLQELNEPDEPNIIIPIK